jgi:2-oxoglutarate dehydrogenase E2 component (dihydrolipoamide succinyltransferase)
MTDVIMPQMGESIAEGTITKWMKKVGDKVERDEPLFEISTDKVDAEIPSPAAGVLSEIRVDAGRSRQHGRGRSLPRAGCTPLRPGRTRAARSRRSPPRLLQPPPPLPLRPRVPSRPRLLRPGPHGSGRAAGELRPRGRTAHASGARPGSKAAGRDVRR